MSFLQSFSIVTPTGMSTWLVDLHIGPQRL